MANSLRAKLSKLRHDGHITDTEYQEFVKKLDGHDKQIRADTIDKCIEMLEHDCFVSGTASKVLIHHFEQLKEQK